MEFNGRLEIKSTDLMLKERGLKEGGAVQKYIDTECLRNMKEYTPKISGTLEKSPKLNTVIGSGTIRQNTPYARYLYYGWLMVSTITGSAWSKGESKMLTGVELEYSKSVNPKAGKLWFERMKEDCKDDILKGAQDIASGGVK